MGQLFTLIFFLLIISAMFAVVHYIIKRAVRDGVLEALVEVSKNKELLDKLLNKDSQN